MNRLKHILLILAVFIITETAYAQRTSYGERMISASVGTSFSHVGGQVAFGSYQLIGFWFGEISFYNRCELDPSSSETVHFPRLEAEGGYMFRLFSNYHRSINLYAGAGAFAGVQMLDLFHTLSQPTYMSYISAGFKEFDFVYGASPRFEAEFFVLPYFALIGGVRFPLTFSTGTFAKFSDSSKENNDKNKLKPHFPIFNYEVSIGVKFNF